MGAPVESSPAFHSLAATFTLSHCVLLHDRLVAPFPPFPATRLTPHTRHKKQKLFKHTNCTQCARIWQPGS